MIRPDGWELRLAEAIEAARVRAFAWGAHDCATFAFDVRRAMTGQDAAAAWRGRYRTPLGAQRQLRRMGHATFAQAATAILGPVKPAPLASRGDIVLSTGDPAFGVCLGATCVFLLPHGLVALPLSSVAMAWGV